LAFVPCQFGGKNGFNLQFPLRVPADVTSVVSVRVNPDERAILEAAAELAHTNLSDFMRRKALESCLSAMSCWVPAVWFSDSSLTSIPYFIVVAGLV
jgi:hypothetical protein